MLMLRITSLIFALLVSWSACAQVPLTGAGKGAPGGATYQGPGDVVSGAVAWGSCARVYNASLASTSTSLCDLVDTTTGTAIGTLRGSSTGFVDLSAYFAGTVTPATACAGGCRVSKVYDQLGGSGWANATNAQRPVLTFSALNGLPGLTGTAAANSLLLTTTTYTQAQPYTIVVVAERTAAFTTESAVMGWTGINGRLSFWTVASTVALTGDGASVFTQSSVADSAFHAMQGVINSTSSVMATDGAEVTGNASATALSGNASRIMRFSGGSSLSGVWMEGGFWGAGFSGTQRTNMNANMHGINGYNF